MAIRLVSRIGCSYDMLILCIVAIGAFAEETSPPVLHFGGCGGAYFLAEPGDFWVEIEKRDLNKTGRETHLRVILAGPDRAVLAEEYLPDDGQKKGSGPGPVQVVRLNTQVPRKGIYALNVTVTEDRYGEDIAWGIRTNCPHYLVETSRGHRDAPHEEPLILRSPEAPGDICFLPERRAFSIEVSGMPAGAEPLDLSDAAGRKIATLQPDEKGVARFTAPADVPRDAVPWRLHLPQFHATVQIDGVTRWPKNCDFRDFSLWTPHAESWFPFHENRWLLSPYSRKVYVDSETSGSVEFEIQNNAFASRAFALSVEFPDQSWNATLPTREITVPARGAAPVSLAYMVPGEGDAWKCHVRVTPQDAPVCSTYATLVLERGAPPAAQPLTIPLVLKPYEHENELFGYLPQYPLANQVYFGADNRPYIVTEASLLRRSKETWAETAEAIQADGEAVSFRARSTKIAFDKDNRLYLVGTTGDHATLLYSRDKGVTLRACAIPGNGTLDIEQFSGHNIPDGPPPLARCTLTETDPKLMWRRVNDLDLFLPEQGADGSITIGEPVPISKKCIGFAGHSGIPSSIVSREDKVHVVWAEATDPEEKVPGVPTFAVTYDRATKTLGAPTLVGYGPPANDVHNTPSITMDSPGYLHILVGTHGRTFKYARSLQPNDAGSGWTAPEDIGPGLRQTYVGLVCDKDDVLHVVFRLWFDDRAYFPAGTYATLTHMYKRPGEAWSEPQPLVISPFSEYSVFYHRLTIDQAGRLFLSYDYWSTFWFYRNDHRGTRRALMLSPDGGETWQLANTVDLLRE